MWITPHKPHGTHFTDNETEAQKGMTSPRHKAGVMTCANLQALFHLEITHTGQHLAQGHWAGQLSSRI